MSRFDDYPLGVDPEGVPWPVHAPRSVDRDRGLGALAGLAVGDALGTTLEFTRPEAPRFPRLATGPHCEVIGGGPFSVQPGQVTDDTQMAICLARSMMHEGGFKADSVAKRYVDWSKQAFDIGSQTSAALALVDEGVAALDAGRRVWEGRGRHPAGNGSLMRTTPIAVFYDGSPERRSIVSMQDSSITHFNPRCQLACAAFNAALGRAFKSLPATPGSKMRSPESPDRSGGRSIRGGYSR